MAEFLYCMENGIMEGLQPLDSYAYVNHPATYNPFSNRILYLSDVNETVWRLFFVAVVFHEDGWGSLFSLNGQMDKFLPCTACMRKFST